MSTTTSNRRRLASLCLLAMACSIACVGETPRPVDVTGVGPPATHPDSGAGRTAGTGGGPGSGGEVGTAGGSGAVRADAATASGGAGGARAGGADGSVPDALADAPDAVADVAAPADGRSGGKPANVIYEFGVVPNSPLPALSTAETAGDIGWFMDPMAGPVVRIRAVDRAQAKERAEVSFGQGILKNGQTIYVGWKARLDIPHPDQSWRNVFQEKSHGVYKLNVPFCMRADANTLRLLNDSGQAFWTHPLPLGTWFTIVMKIVYSDNPQVGSIEVWLDGEPQKFTGGSTIQHLPTWGGGQQDIHWGIYRRGTVEGTDIHDVKHVRVATTLADAIPPP